MAYEFSTEELIEMSPQVLSQDAKERKRQQQIQLALDVIDECRVQLMLKFRFLDLALWRMPCEPFAGQMRYPLASDGSKLYFVPERILARFSDSFAESIRDLLHLILHCVFRHPFDEHHTNSQAWSLACDVVVEHAAMDICDKRFATALDFERRAALDELSLLCAADLNPAKLYRLFDAATKAPSSSRSSTAGVAATIDKSKLATYSSLFERDEHEFWEMYAKEEKSDEQISDEEENFSDKPDDNNDEHPDALQLDMNQQSDDENQEHQKSQGDFQKNEQDRRQQNQQNDQNQQDAKDENERGVRQENEEQNPQEQSKQEQNQEGERQNEPDAQEDMQDAKVQSRQAQDDKNADELGQNAKSLAQKDLADKAQSKDQKQKEWEDIAKQIEMDLQTFSKEWGKEAASLVGALKIANQKTYDYDKFLRKFAALSEEIKINDDEFDYVYYTYGLHLYGNMPLIEPLEYQETNRVRTFVIALDTSASCSGSLVKSFVQHTFNILMSSQYFAHEIDVRIVQCDSKLQAITSIKNVRDIQAYMQEFKVRGGGGTDFRPVFAYVNDLRKQGELTNLKGLIYFTDGLGTFPSYPPEYESAFVFMRDNQNSGSKDSFSSSKDFSPKVPPWAIKLMISEEDIEEFTS